MSVRRACEALRIDRSLYTYKSKRGEQADLKLRIKEICETRVRYGYRRVHVLLLREGWPINMKRTRRLYNELGLQLRNKTPKRRVKAKLREDRTDATHSNQIWAMDFVHDQLATGRKLRILTIVDTHSRYAPATDPRFSYRGEDVVQTLERVCQEVGYPKMIRVDNVLCQQGELKIGQQVSVREFAPAVRSSSIQAASTGMEELSAIANIGSSGCAVALTVLKTRCKSRWKTQALSTGSRLAPSRQHGEGFSHLVPAPQRRDGSRNRF